MKALLLISFLFVGCYHSANLSENTNLKDIDFSNVEKWKRGESCESYLLGLFGPLSPGAGGSSVVDAVKKAKVSKVHVVEYSFSWPVVAAKYCTIVYGE